MSTEKVTAELNLPSKWKPGTDLMNKKLLSEAKVINLIGHSLADAPDDSYLAAQTEWADGSRSDVLNTSHNNTLPPILIESRYYVDQTFMHRIMSYSANVYKRYKKLPIVLVIVTKSFSKARFRDEFTTTDDGLFLETSCNLWGKQCFLLTADAVASNLNKESLNPKAALGHFVIRHKVWQIPQHHWSNPTLIQLVSIVKEIISENSNEMVCKPSVTYLLNQIKRNLEDIIEESDDKESDENKRIKSRAEEGLLSIGQLRNELVPTKVKNKVRLLEQTVILLKMLSLLKVRASPERGKTGKIYLIKGKQRAVLHLTNRLRP